MLDPTGFLFSEAEGRAFQTEGGSCEKIHKEVINQMDILTARNDKISRLKDQ